MLLAGRKPWVAALLSLEFPGLGHGYLGRWRRGGVYAAGYLLLAALVLAAFVAPDRVDPRLLYVCGALSIGLYLAVAVAAFRAGWRAGPATVPPRWRRVALFGAFILTQQLLQGALTTTLRSSARSFRLPTSSMAPTLLPGDFIMADLRAGARSPGIGDLVVHEAGGRRVHVKRVIALGGDRIEIRDKLVHRDGQRLEEPYVQYIDPTIRPAALDPRDNLAPTDIPPGTLFLLGDNRDNSNDSRFHGPIADAAIVGTVRWIYWSWDAEAGRVRWERLGRRVN